MLKKIESDYKTKYDRFYSHSKVETIINEIDIDNVFESIYTTIISNIQNVLRKGLGWIIIQSLMILLIFQSIIL